MDAPASRPEAIILSEKEKLEEARGLIEQCLGKVKLSTNKAKTSLSHVSDGVVYLGYYMDSKGKGPARKSVEGLEMKLSQYDKLRKTDNASEKLGEAIAAIRGWYNYYKTLKAIKPGNILSLIALVRLATELGETSLARDLLKESKSFAYNHPEICFQLGELYAGFGMHNQAMREYARALELDPSMEAAKEKVRKLQEGEENIHQAIEKIQLLLHHNPHYREGYQKLAELYAELGLYGFAEKARRKALEIDDEAEAEPDDAAPRAQLAEPSGENGFDYQSVDLDTFVGVFSGRRDAHAKQWVDERGKWGFARVDRPLKTRDAHGHLKGDITLAVYPVTARDTVNFVVFDVDTAKRILLESGGELIEDFRNKAHQDILKIKSSCDELGLTLYIEDSGYKGRHGWLFFAEELPAAQAIQAGREIMKKSGGPSEAMIWELFPMGKSERHQSLIKLPLGINRKNNRRCLFLNPDNHPIADQALFLKTIKRNNVSDVRKLLENGAGEGAEGGALLPGDHGRGALSPGIAKMVKSCKVIDHLVSKARDTNYLNHHERTCLLYTLSFAGEEGCKLLHKVISYCINYDYQYTQKQIDRRKASPMSCAKIMENFPELAETLHCDCKFNLPSRSYPSPVLYLLQSEIEGATAAPPTRKPGEDESESAGRDTPTAEETAGPQTPTLDFERIFSEEVPSGEEEEAGDESGETMPDEHPAPVDDLSEAHGRDGYEEWSDEEPGAVPGGEKACKAGDAPANSESMEDLLSDVTAVEEKLEEKSREKPEAGLGEDSIPPHDNAEREACELMLRYFKLKQGEEGIRRELAGVIVGLECLFDSLGADNLDTFMGSIRRVRRDGGKSSWVLATRD